MINNVYFLGHGNPLWAITDSPYSQKWNEIGLKSPQPEAIIVISAHWMTAFPNVTANDYLPTIHDFSGFPKELYEVKYPAPGNPKLALSIAQLLSQFNCETTTSWGLDHGSWSLLKHIYPNANIPVVQVSLSKNEGLNWHFQLGKELSQFRKENIMILGSGNVVHNLYKANWQANAQAHINARSFDQLIKKIIINRETNQLLDVLNTHQDLAHWAAPTIEHFLPLVVSYGASYESDEIEIFNEDIDMGSISMTSYSWSRPNA